MAVNDPVSTVVIDVEFTPLGFAFRPYAGCTGLICIPKRPYPWCTSTGATSSPVGNSGWPRTASTEQWPHHFPLQDSSRQPAPAQDTRPNAKRRRSSTDTLASIWSPLILETTGRPGYHAQKFTRNLHSTASSRHHVTPGACSSPPHTRSSIVPTIHSGSLHALLLGSDLSLAWLLVVSRRNRHSSGHRPADVGCIQ